MWRGVSASPAARGGDAVVSKDCVRRGADQVGQTRSSDAIRGSNQRELFSVCLKSTRALKTRRATRAGVLRHNGKDQSPSGYDAYFVGVCRQQGATISQALELWRGSTLASRLSEAERERKGARLLESAQQG